MLESRHNHLSRPTTTGSMADPKLLMPAISRLTGHETRKVTNPKTVERTRQESGKENALNELADGVL